ncbi:ABC transporter permease [Microvirga rosea]|uniref:ABC transporter permease n=1 Tax=Microvirga rosea TaxID=2715425 RepID=UPI001D0AA7B1|nr:ABC transporter permease [Microvirga rosea]MCB8823193.1 ABC transporter permease [Microvirga rosea]
MRRILAPLAALTVLLAVWHYSVFFFSVDPTVLPSPADVGSALYTGLVRGTLHVHVLATLKAAAMGFVVGCCAGVGLGVLLGEFRVGARFIFPVVVALQAMPVVAIAPLLIVWLGIGTESKVFLAAIVCFFPTFVNTFSGMHASKSELLDLYKAAGASRWLTLRDVKLPSAAHFIFTGLQIAVVLSLTGCVVGEFIAATSGLGYVIKSLAGQLDVSMMFAAIFTLSALGMACGLLVRTLHRAIVFW